jgi:hypothetical protein
LEPTTTVNIGKMFLGHGASPFTIVGMCAVRSLPSLISHPVQNLEVEGQFGAKEI